MSDLYRRRLIPDECLHLKNDHIIHISKDIIVTKWNTIHPKAEFSHGISMYCLNEGWKISKFFTSENKLKYIYCDIIDTDYNSLKDEYIFTDLLADVIIENSGFVKVVDLDELADACSNELISTSLLTASLHRLNNLLSIIYDGSFKDYIYKLESNIDDCTGEILGYVMDRLYNAGAREVNYMPVFMKKNRPGWLITVICKEENIKTLENIIFAETTTIGIRRQKMERTILKREISEIATPLGNAVVKVCDFGDSKVFYPEYESAAAIAKKNNVPLKEVYDIIKREINSGGQCGKKEKD